MTGLRAVEAKIQDLQYEMPEGGSAFLEHSVTGKLFLKICFNAVVNSSIRTLSAVPSMIYDLAYGIFNLDTAHLKDAALTIPKVIVHLTKDVIALGICAGVTAFIVTNAIKIIAIGCVFFLVSIVSGCGPGFWIFKACEFRFS